MKLALCFVTFCMTLAVHANSPPEDIDGLLKSCYEGQLVLTGRGYYTCRKTHLEPAGCDDSDLKLVKIGSTYVHDFIAYRCVLSLRTKVPYLVSTGCLDTAGRPVQPNSFFKDNGHTVKCIQNPYGDYTIEYM